MLDLDDLHGSWEHPLIYKLSTIVVNICTINLRNPISINTLIYCIALHRSICINIYWPPVIQKCVFTLLLNSDSRIDNSNGPLWIMVSGLYLFNNLFKKRTIMFISHVSQTSKAHGLETFDTKLLVSNNSLEFYRGIC